MKRFHLIIIIIITMVSYRVGNNTSERTPDKLYRIYAKFTDRLAWANSVYPDQTPQNAASDQGLHYLPVV